jgi:hypothetical protein
MTAKRLLTPKENSILSVAARGKIPTENQSYVLLDILEKARAEGIGV